MNEANHHDNHRSVCECHQRHLSKAASGGTRRGRLPQLRTFNP